MTVGNGNGRKQRLELTWIGKDIQPRLEPRILLPVPEQSYVKGKGINDNILIEGDNLLALKSLEQEYAGKVKCIFIDPPYNTGSAFEQYDDGVEHSLWLSLMRDRVEALRRLLTDDGSIWITIDDSEQHYLRCLMDEIFGRENFVACVVWQKRIGPDARAVLGAAHDYIVVYAKDLSAFKEAANSVPLREEQIAQYRNPDNDPRGPWTTSSNFSAQGYRRNQMYKITTPAGVEYYPPQGRCWITIEPEYIRLLQEGRMWFGRDGRGMPRKKTYLNERNGQAAWTWWPNDEVGNTQESKKESIALFGADAAFSTPKPERLLHRILSIASNPDDIVLDSFAGSGTTGAVAHKMGRRWIMVELGDHATTHIVPRLRKVIDGQDSGGVTEAVGWKGGGGYRFYRLAPSLIETDEFGQKIISKQYNAEMLAEAMCKHMGFTYAPSRNLALYWQQGYSSERDFIFVTTKSLTHDALKALSVQVGPDRTLLICCTAFRARLGDFPNLTVKKIPQAVLHNCEWGRDDYSLNIAQPAEDTEPDGGGSGGNGGSAPRRRGRQPASANGQAEVAMAPARKAPLKMDGTTRATKVGKQVRAVEQVVPVRTKAKATKKQAAKSRKAKARAARRTKPASNRQSKTAKKTLKSKAKKTSTSTSRNRGRHFPDERQGRLL